MISSASLAPSSGTSGVAWTRTTTSSPSTSSSSTDAPLRVGVEISWSRIACTWLGRTPEVSRTLTSTAVGLPQRHDHRGEHLLVRDHDRSAPRASVGVQQAERADDALDLPAEGAGLQPDPFADPERPGAEQHHSGDHVAKRLLGGETEDDGGECSADGQRLERGPGDAEREDERDAHGHQADQEAERPGGGGIHAAHEGRTDEATDRRASPQPKARTRMTRDHPHAGSSAVTSHVEQRESAGAAVVQGTFRGSRQGGRGTRHRPRSAASRKTTACRWAFLTTFSLTSNESPTFSQASLRVSNMRSRLLILYVAWIALAWLLRWWDRVC